MEDIIYSIILKPISETAYLLNFGMALGIIVLSFIGLWFLLWHLKGVHDNSIFTLTRESIGEQSNKIRDMLAGMKVNKRELNYTLLLLEEIIVRLHENAQEAVTVRIRRFFGDISISLDSKGENYNPFASLESWDIETEDYLRDMIFRAHKANLSYTRRNGHNMIVIHVHRTANKMVHASIAAMILGVVIGLGMKWLPEAASAYIANNVLSTVQTVFLNALMLLLAPVVFFSVSTSLSNLSGGNEIGRIGSKVLGSYILTTIAAILIGFCISSLFFSGSLPPMPDNITPVSEEIMQPMDFSIRSVLLAVIPKDFISPLTGGNMLQLIFLAVFTSIALRALGDKTAGIKNLFTEANSLFLKMMEMVISFMPLVIFSSMALLIFSSDAATLSVLVKYLAALVAGSLVLLVAYLAIILVAGRISPLHYLRKVVTYLITPLMIPSSNACIPLTIDFCKKKLGVSSKIASFTVPLGATINMNGLGMALIITVMLLARMCGVEIDFGTCMKIGVLTLLLSIGTPGIPNSGLVVLATLLETGGVPVASIGFLIGVWNIVDRLATTFNVNGDIVTSLVIAKSENELDTSVYSSCPQ